MSGWVGVNEQRNSVVRVTTDASKQPPPGNQPPSYFKFIDIPHVQLASHILM